MKKILVTLDILHYKFWGWLYVTAERRLIRYKLEELTNN
jgi:hypothetical protein